MKFETLGGVIQWANEEELKSGDPLWFLAKSVDMVTNNAICLAIVIFSLIFCGAEVFGQLYVVVNYDVNFDLVLNYGPMFVSSLHTIFAGLPFILQKQGFRHLTVFMKQYFWSLYEGDIKAMQENRTRTLVATYISMLFLSLVVIGSTAMLSFKSIDYGNTIFPPIAFLNAVQPPTIVNNITVICNFAMIYIKAFIMLLYFLHFMYFVVHYEYQITLLKWNLVNMERSSKLGVSDSVLPDHKNYQSTVKSSLRHCIGHHITLEKFAKSMTNYMSVPLLCLSINSITILTSTSYIILLHKNNTHQFAVAIEFFGTLAVIFLYCYYAQIFQMQNEGLLHFVFATKWNTFNIKNQRALLIFATLLNKPHFMSGAGILVINYERFTWIVHKAVNLLSILAVMTD